jgi:hypothetical protein
MNELTKADIDTVEQFKKVIDNQLKMLSKKPNEKAVKTNKFANNSKYLEIGYIEAQLDRLFATWDWEVLTVQQIANGIVVSGKLTVTTYAGMNIVRSGVAGVEIQTKAGAQTLDPSSVASKAMDRDPGRAEAYALKSAAAKLGNAFGRNLNRSFNHEHVPESELLTKLKG